MLRRAALLVCLLAPLAAGAAASAGQVNLSPKVVGRTTCSSTADADQIRFEWSVVFSTTTNTVQAGDTFQIVGSNTKDCPKTDTTAGILTVNVGPSITATAITGTYPGATDTPIHAIDFVNGLGAPYACTGASRTVYVCVQLRRAGTTVGSASAPDGLLLELADPPIPVGVSITPGDSALNVSWADGTGSGLATATSYRVVATAVDPAKDPATHQATTTTRSLRLSGLVNDVTYSVVVFARSDGGNESQGSAAVQGTPRTVEDFFTYYKAQGGVEEGGCGGGPAGLLSLAGLGALLRAFRRRS
ncbi:MAG TPA: fibronectin type III domain-containing protein [Anaeromyxobacteraceae bacterium]|nr:fibronectin type III domain-containing protein [Anaeromyxobacteraceae bacterium]